MIRTDFETPLRELPNKITSWRRIGDQDASLDRTLKEYEKASSKREKAEAKSKGGKADLLQQEVNQLSSQLMSLSPMVYSTYQKLDEDRLRALKETVVRFGTVRGDMATRDGERADSGMAAMLGWEPSDEVRLVGRRLGSAGTGGGSRPLPPSATPSAQTTRKQSSTPSSQYTERQLEHCEDCHQQLPTRTTTFPLGHLSGRMDPLRMWEQAHQEVGALQAV